tara:strand:- start:17418 stop:17876 length:459 start_codon:yes stop_codon:yes gene_type:complete
MGKEFYLKVLAILLIGISPFIMLITYGELNSISQYWTTPLQPLFIISNTITAYLLFEIKNWKKASIFLMLLTSFSVVDFGILHNIFAGLFFFFSLQALWETQRLGGYIIVYGIAMILLPFNLFWSEVIAVSTLCSYHLHLLIYKKNLLKKKP